MQNRFPFSRWSALAFATFIFASCALNQEPSPQLGASGTDIINHPERHVGQQVSIIGTVNNVYSRGSFTVGPEGFLQTDLRVLARGPERNVPRLRSGERVRIVGVVRVFTRREFLGGYPTGFYGTGFGFYGFGPAYAMGPGFYGLRGPGFYPDYYTTWESQPIIIAHRVERL